MKTRLLIIFLSISLFYSCSSIKDQNPEIVNEKHNRAVEYSQLGIKFFSDRDYTKALDFFFLALKQNITIDNEEGIITSYISIGKTYFATEDLKSAEIYYKKGDLEAENYGDPLLRAQTLNTLGELQLSKKNYPQALEYFNQALLLIKNQEKSPDAADILQNMGIVFKRKNEYDSAKIYIGRSLDINKKLKRYKETGANYYLLSSVLSKTGQYPEALEYIEKALNLDKNQENDRGIAKDIYAMGILYQYQRDYNQAYIYFRKSVLIYETLSMPNEVIKTLKNLEETAKKLSLDDEALMWEQTRKKLESNI